MIDKLKAIQKLLGESDEEFALRLHIKRAAWQAVRSGRCKPGYKTFPAIIAYAPSLIKDVQNEKIITSNVK